MLNVLQKNVENGHVVGSEVGIIQYYSAVHCSGRYRGSNGFS